MRAYLAVSIALAACGNPRGPTDLVAFSNSGGGLVPCQPGDTWCAYDGSNFGGLLQIMSRDNGMRAEGMLTQQSLDELEAITQAIPISTPTENFVCADAPRKTIELDFLPEGTRVFRYDCDPGALQRLDNFLSSAIGELQTCQTVGFRFLEIDCF